MKKIKHLSWDNFVGSILIRGEQRVHRINNSPVIEVFGDGVINRVGIWIESSDNIVVPESAQRLASVSAQIICRDEKTFLEIFCDARLIFRQFYLFATAVADRVTQHGLSPSAAVDLELQCFAELLEEKPLLSLERQLGLIGELLVLECLLDVDGPDAIDAWIGPLGEPHDFRIGRREFEVKTASATRRIHTINGLNQLLPSHGCSLFLFSILLGPGGSGGGFSLATKVEHLYNMLNRASSRAKQFESALDSCGYSEADAAHYLRRFDLRRPLAIVPVNQQLPVITSREIRAVFDSEASRIEHITYDLNVEGLEKEEGANEYGIVFPYPYKKK